MCVYTLLLVSGYSRPFSALLIDQSLGARRLVVTLGTAHNDLRANAVNGPLNVEAKSPRVRYDGGETCHSKRPQLSTSLSTFNPSDGVTVAIFPVKEALT